MATPLYSRHSRGLAATYADVENHALNQGDVLVGTPGSVTLRTNATGVRFYARQYYDHEGRKKDQYISAQPGSPDAERLVSEWRARIDELREVVKMVRMLTREGYAAITPRHFAALTPLVTHGLFRAGAVLVGTHAFDVIVNKMGVRAAAYGTEDLDLARPTRLALDGIPKGGLLEVLQESGIDFVEVPPLDRKQPSTKYKERGRSRFTFDLLVPAAGDEFGIVAVPELNAHATALPYFRYLLGETQNGAALSSHGVAAVRIPVPERFALHKMIVAQRRKGRSEKSLKDLHQAVALIAALGEMYPGTLTSAYERLPLSTRKHVRKSLEQIGDQLEPHPQSREEMAGLVV